MKQQLVYLLCASICFIIHSTDTINPPQSHTSMAPAGHFPLRPCRALCDATTVADATLLLTHGALNCTCDAHQKKYCTPRLMQIIMAQKYSPDLIPLYLDRGISVTDIDCFKSTPLKCLIVLAYEYRRKEHLSELKTKLGFIFSRLNSQKILEYTDNDEYVTVDILCYHKGTRYLESMLKANLHEDTYRVPYKLLSDEITLQRAKALEHVQLDN